MAEIKEDLREMQARGYYGDGEYATTLVHEDSRCEGLVSIHADTSLGFWSDGRRLRDSATMAAEGLSTSLNSQGSARNSS